MNPALHHQIEKEVEFQASRSAGPGGQHVNKSNTKVILRFDVPASTVLTAEEKSKLLKALATRLTKNGELILHEQGSRSQAANKQVALNRLFGMVEQGLKPRKRRIPTRLPRKKKIERLENKKKLSEKKKLRRKSDF